MVPREAAAWTVARHLGWPDLVSRVRRRLRLPAWPRALRLLRVSRAPSVGASGRCRKRADLGHPGGPQVLLQLVEPVHFAAASVPRVPDAAPTTRPVYWSGRSNAASWPIATGFMRRTRGSPVTDASNRPIAHRVGGGVPVHARSLEAAAVVSPFVSPSAGFWLCRAKEQRNHIRVSGVRVPPPASKVPANARVLRETSRAINTRNPPRVLRVWWLLRPPAKATVTVRLQPISRGLRRAPDFLTIPWRPGLGAPARFLNQLIPAWRRSGQPARVRPVITALSSEALGRAGSAGAPDRPCGHLLQSCSLHARGHYRRSAPSTRER
jgi:hypothetical protein